MSQLAMLITYSLLLSLLVAVDSARASDPPSPLSANLLPHDEKVLLIIGQDLDSIAGYVDSGYFPTPGGVTTYVAFYQMNKGSYPAYGALGMDNRGTFNSKVVNWGAGALNAHRSAVDYPDSALVIGLSIAEGSGDQVWADGGLADITVGAYDDNIRLLARFLNAIDNPVYLRIGYEFDGQWNRRYENRSSYVYAYRHIVDLLREEGVTNVAYVWQASASPIDDIVDGHREAIIDWYPGDNYVDWMGHSWFLPPDDRVGDVPTQRILANEVVSLARDRGKPVMIAESSPQGYDLDMMTKANIGAIWDGQAGGNRVGKTSIEIWREWFHPLFDYIHENRDVIRAVAYINADWDGHTLWSAPYSSGYWGDSRLQITGEIRSRWLQEINNQNFWQHGEKALPSRLHSDSRQSR